MHKATRCTHRISAPAWWAKQGREGLHTAARKNYKNMYTYIPPVGMGISIFQDYDATRKVAEVVLEKRQERLTICMEFLPLP